MRTASAAAMAAAIGAALAGWTAVDARAAQPVAEDPKDIVADQIRRQGYACTKALSAERDAALSQPNAAVWTLKCEGVTYRVHLVPDMAARVERLD